MVRLAMEVRRGAMVMVTVIVFVVDVNVPRRHLDGPGSQHGRDHAPEQTAHEVSLWNAIYGGQMSRVSRGRHVQSRGHLVGDRPDYVLLASGVILAIAVTTRGWGG